MILEMKKSSDYLSLMAKPGMGSEKNRLIEELAQIELCIELYSLHGKSLDPTGELRKTGDLKRNEIVSLLDAITA